METLHKDDREKLLAYVERINEKQEFVSIHLTFKIISDEQRFLFTTNGKLSIKDSIDGAICFLDGMNVFADELGAYSPYNED